MRLPVLSHAGVLDPAFVAAWWTIVDESTATCELFLPFHLVELAGVPLEELIPPA